MNHGFLDEKLLLSRITEKEFLARRSRRIEQPVSDILHSIDQISKKHGGVRLVIFGDTVIEGLSLGIEPDFDDDGVILDYWVVGILGSNGVVTLVPDYLADHAIIYQLAGNSE